MENNTNQTGGMCKCPHHKALPTLVILFGLTFLLGALGILTWGAVSIIWPIILILAGFAKLSGRKCKCCKADAPMSK